MRVLGRIVGWLCLLAAIAVVAAMVAARLTGESPAQPLGQIWFALDAGSLNTLQAVVERYLWPPLWDYVVFPVLRAQAAMVALIALAAGVGLLLITRRPAAGMPRRRLFKR